MKSRLFVFLALVFVLGGCGEDRVTIQPEGGAPLWYGEYVLSPEFLKVSQGAWNGSVTFYPGRVFKLELTDKTFPGLLYVANGKFEPLTPTSVTAELSDIKVLTAGPGMPSAVLFTQRGAYFKAYPQKRMKVAVDAFLSGSAILKKLPDALLDPGSTDEIRFFKAMDNKNFLNLVVQGGTKLVNFLPKESLKLQGFGETLPVVDWKWKTWTPKKSPAGRSLYVVEDPGNAYVPHSPQAQKFLMLASDASASVDGMDLNVSLTASLLPDRRLGFEFAGMSQKLQVDQAKWLHATLEKAEFKAAGNRVIGRQTKREGADGGKIALTLLLDEKPADGELLLELTYTVPGRDKKIVQTFPLQIEALRVKAVDAPRGEWR